MGLAFGRSAAATVFQNFGVQGFTLVANLATGLIVARALGPRGRGEQAAIAMWVTFFSALSSFGVPNALRYWVRQKIAERSQFLFAATCLGFALGIGAAAVGVAIIPLWMHEYAKPIVREAQYLMVFAPTLMLFQMFSAYLEGVGDFRRANVGRLCVSAIVLLSLIGLWFVHRLTPYTSPLAYVIPYGLVTAAIAFSIRKSFDPSDVRKRFHSLLSWGSRSYGNDLILAFSTQIDQALILAFLSARSLGLYAVALTVSRTMMMLPASTWTVLFSRVAGLSPSQAVSMVLRGGRIAMGLSLVLAIIFAAVQPVIVPLVYGQAFREAVPLSMILTFETVFSATATILTVSFAAAGRPFLSTGVNGIWLASTIALLYLLVPRLGIVGAATALLCSGIIRLVAVMTFYRVALGEKVPWLLPNSEDLAYLLARFRPAALHEGSTSV